MKNTFFILISFLIISCSSNSKLVGEYQANISDSTYYTFNFANKQYLHKRASGTYTKGKFKILNLNPEKKLLVCNEWTHGKSRGLITETTNSGDSIYVGTYFGYEKLGQTVFEITSKENTLSYRKTHANNLQRTDGEGTLIKK